MPFLWRWVAHFEKSDDVWFDHRIHPKRLDCAPDPRNALGYSSRTVGTFGTGRAGMISRFRVS